MDPRRSTAVLRPDARRALRWSAAAAWALLVALVLWISGPEEAPAWPWLAAFERAGGDKLVHAALFGVQAWLLLRCRPGTPDLGWLAACFGAAVVYGAVTELGQLPLAGRDASPADALADAAGAALVIGLVTFRRRRRGGTR